MHNTTATAIEEKPAGRAPGCGQGGRTTKRAATAASGDLAERLPEEGTKDRQPQTGDHLRLLSGLDAMHPILLDQLGPDKVPIVGSEVSPSDSALRCALDRHAVVWRERPITSSPWGHVSHVLIPQFPCQIGLRAQKINDAGNCQGKSVRLGHGPNSIMVRVSCQTMLEIAGARVLVFGYGD